MTANDSDMSDGDTLTGSQVVRVYGENLTAPFVTLTFGGVEYTPLGQGEGYIEYLLGDNGTATINVDGSSFMSFEVEGIVVPDIMPTDMSAALYATGDNNLSNPTEILQYAGNCMNYPILATEEKPYIGVSFNWPSDAGLQQSDFSIFDGTITFFSYQANRWRFRIRPTDPSKPVYLLYGSFIIFVGNYTTD